METHSTLIIKVLRETEARKVKQEPEDAFRIWSAICQICDNGQLKPLNGVESLRVEHYICPLCQSTYTTFEVEQMNKNHTVFTSQRVIKFRYWDVTNKEMITDVLELNNLGNLINIKEKTLSNPTWKCVWQQFTGFTDIDGVEIYEGDIVEYTNNYMKDVTINLVVKYRNGGFKLWWKTSDYYFDIDKGSVKVVGHIFDLETPKVK